MTLRIPLLRFRLCFQFAALLFLQTAWSGPEVSPVVVSPLRLLTIGNSFADNMLQYIPFLLKESAQPLVLYRANLNGASYEKHATHLRQWRQNPDDPASKVYPRPHVSTGEAGPFSLPEVLTMSDWDVVTVQQVSHLSYIPHSYDPHAAELLEAIREFAPNAEILVHQIWAYREDHRFFETGDFTPGEMHRRMRSTQREFAARNVLRLIPVGDAFHLARQTDRWSYKPDPDFSYEAPEAEALPGEQPGLFVGYAWRTVHNRRSLRLDGFHANLAGSYLGSCVLFKTLFPDRELPARAPPGLSNEDAADLRAVTLWTLEDFAHPGTLDLHPSE